MIGSLYSEALRRGSPLEVVDATGRAEVLPVDLWRSPVRPGDASVAARCVSPTLDVGCGPGRLTVALRANGITAEGIDPNAAAVRLARRAGAVVHRCSVFGAVPRPGHWRTAVLIDGNVGIGGDPVALLARVADLISGSGTIVVEVGGPNDVTDRGPIRLRSPRRLSRPFPWARLAIPDVAVVSAAAGLRLEESWSEADRWFVVLRAG